MICEQVHVTCEISLDKRDGHIRWGLLHTYLGLPTFYALQFIHGILAGFTTNQCNDNIGGLSNLDSVGFSTKERSILNRVN